MNFEDKMQLAVEMANFRIEISRNTAGELMDFHPSKAPSINQIKEIPVGDELYEKLVSRMLDFIEQQEKSSPT